MSEHGTARYACGVDLGGTLVVVALVDLDGGIACQREIRDHSGKPASVIVARDGVILANSNLPGFTRYPLAVALRGRFDTRIAVDNDANAQAYAEYLFGAAHGIPTMAFVTVSTGIGAGLVIDGHLYRGVTGTAGEIGHTIVNPNSRLRCGCGNYGCLMAHASVQNV